MRTQFSKKCGPAVLLLGFFLLGGCQSAKVLPNDSRIPASGKGAGSVVQRENCETWDPSQISDSAFENALAEVKGGSTEWIRSLPHFKDLPPSELTIEKEEAGGGLNFGLFIVSVRSEPHLILKIADCDEVKSSWKVSQTALAYPHCILALKERGDRKLAPFQLNSSSSIPGLAKVLAVHKSSDHCEQLMELAPGAEGSDFVGKGNYEVQADLGAKLALLHLLGVSHGDLNPRNYFYQPSTGKLTLIDYGTLQLGISEPKLRDLKRVVGYDSEVLADSFQSSLDTIKTESFQNNFPAFKRAVLQENGVSDKIGGLIRLKTKMLEKIAFLHGYLRKLSPHQKEMVLQDVAQSSSNAKRKVAQSMESLFRFSSSEVTQFFKRYPELDLLINEDRGAQNFK